MEKILIMEKKLKKESIWAYLVAQIVQNLPAIRETQVQTLIGKIHWRREWLPTLVFLLENFMDEEPGKLQSMRSQRVRQD